jgi:STAS domain
MPDSKDQPGRPASPAAHPRGPRAPRPVRCVRAPGFVLTSRAVRDADRVTVAGELVAATAGLLDDEIVELCRFQGPAGLDLVLDLTEVDVLDVLGVAALRRVHHRMQLQGRLRLGLPVAVGPGRLLALAIDCGWLPPRFGVGLPPP